MNTQRKRNKKLKELLKIHEQEFKNQKKSNAVLVNELPVKIKQVENELLWITV